MNSMPYVSSHAPADYACPFCDLVTGAPRHPDTLGEPADIVLETPLALAIIAPAGYEPDPGHVLVITRDHFENLYELPDDAAAAVMITSRQIAKAIKAAWVPDGVSLRQHNEPAGNQDVWHYHQHVFPRWKGDRLYDQRRGPLIDPEIRARKALELQDHLGSSRGACA